MEIKLENKERIENEEFYGRDDITSIVFSKSLKSIGDKAFMKCTNLKVIDLPEGVEFIGHYAFSRVKAVIFVPKSIKQINREAFSRGSVVFFEGDEKDFKGYYDEYEDASYPDSFHRGPSMGLDLIQIYYYESGVKRFYNSTHDDFLNYINRQ